MSNDKSEKTNISLFEVFSHTMANIAALTPFEYKEKAEKLICDNLLISDPSFKDAKYVKPSAEEIEALEINIAWYSNYNELLEDAQVLSNVFARCAYQEGMGRLHRSLARISLILVLTASEDYANLMCQRDKGLSKTALKRRSLLSKWQLLIPDLDQKFPMFSSLIHLRACFEIGIRLCKLAPR